MHVKDLTFPLDLCSGRGHFRGQRGLRSSGLGRYRREDLSQSAASPRHARLPTTGVGGIENPLPTFFAAAGGSSGIQAGATPRQR